MDTNGERLQVEAKGPGESKGRRRRAPGVPRIRASHLRALFDSPWAAMAFMAEDGRLLEANRAFAERLGTTAASLRGANLETLRHPDDPGDGFCARLSATPEGALVDMVFALPDGAPMPARVAVSNGCLDAEDVRVYALILEPPRSEQRPVEPAIDPMGLVDIGADTLGIWQIHLDCGEMRINDRLAIMLGYAPGNVALPGHSWAGLIHPDDKARHLDAIREHARRRTPLYEVEMRLRHASGHWRSVITRGCVRKRAPDGKPLRAVAVHLDITERREVEDALRRRDAILEAVAFSAERFLAARTWTDEVEGMLERLGVSARAGRVYLFEKHFDSDGTVLVSQRYLWTAPGAESQVGADAYQNLPVVAEGYGRWEDTLSRGGTITGNVAELPECERRHLQADGIHSLALVPVFVDARQWGFIGFGECGGERDWSSAEIDVLRIAASTLGAAIQRDSHERAIRDSRERLRAQYQGIPVPTFTWRRQADDFVLDDYNAEALRIARVFVEGALGRGARESLAEFPVALRHLEICYTERRAVREEMVYRPPDGQTDYHLDLHYAYVSPDIVMVHAIDMTQQLRAEQTLRESNEQLDLALRGANLGAWDWDLRTGRFACNPRFAEMLGYDLGAFADGFQIWQQCVHPEDRPRLFAALRAHIRGHEPYFSTELRMMDGRGDWRWVLGLGRVVERDAKGQAVRISGTQLDITDRKKSEGLTRLLLELGLALGSLNDLDGAMDCVLDAAFRTGGIDTAGIYLVDRATGGLYLARHRGASAAFAEEVAYFGPDTLQAAIVRAMRPYYANRRHHPEPIGAHVIENIGFSAFAMVPISHDNMLIGALNVASRTLDEFPAAVRDTLESLGLHVSGVLHRIRTEEALRESEERYRRLVELLPWPIVVHDGSRFLYVNPATVELMRAESAEQIQQFGLSEVIHPAHRDEVVGRVEAVLREGRRAPLAESRVRRIDGTFADIEATGTRIMYDGRPAVLAVLNDVTARKQAEEEDRRREQRLAQADKLIALGVLVSGIAHEVNNPNQLVIGNITLLREVYESILPVLDTYHRETGEFVVAGLNYGELRDQMREVFAETIAGAQRIQRIVQELRDYAPKGTGLLDELVDLNHVVEFALLLTRGLVRESTERFDCRLEEDLPVVRGNLQGLEQVAVNLIMNACEALPAPDRRVEVATAHDPARGVVTLMVIDEGTGMTADVLRHATDPFFTTKRGEGGMGLGLAIAARVVHQHGGTISFDSRPGAGTTVTVTLSAHGAARGVLEDGGGAPG